jgi:hypothetical protein
MDRERLPLLSGPPEGGIQNMKLSFESRLQAAFPHCILLFDNNPLLQ